MLVGWEDGIERVPDPAVGHDQRQPREQPFPTGLEGRQAERVSERQIGVREDGKRQAEPGGQLR